MCLDRSRRPATESADCLVNMLTGLHTFLTRRPRGPARARRLLLVLGIGLGTLISAASLAHATWFFPEPIADGYLNEQRCVTTDWRGWIHAAWVNNSRVYYTRSEGWDWLPIEELTAADTLAQSDAPAIAADAAGNIHVLWADYSGMNPRLHYTRWDGVGWSAISHLTDGTSGAYYPDMAADVNGNTYVVWSDTRDAHLEIYYTFWDGIAWAPEARLSDLPSESRVPTIAADLNGNVHVAWEDLRDGASEIYYKRWDGITWTADTRLTYGNTYAVGPALTADLNGHVHLAWEDARESYVEIYYKYWDGMAWSADLRLTDAPGESRYPSIAVDLLDNIHIAWMDGRNGQWEVYYKTWDGAAWSDDVDLTPGAQSAEWPSVTTDWIGQLHLAYETGSQVMYRRNADPPAPELVSLTPAYGSRDDQVGVRVVGEGFVYPDSIWLERTGEPRVVAEILAGAPQEMTCRFDLIGVEVGLWDVVLQNPDGQQSVLSTGFEVQPAIQWSEEMRLSDYPNDSGGASIATDSNGLVHVVWTDDRDGASEVYYKQGSGAEWSDDLRLSDLPYSSCDPAVATGPDDQVHVVWVDYRNGSYRDLYYASWNGAAWSPNQQLTDTYGNRENPRIAVNVNGDVYVVWTDWEGGATIYYKVFDGVTWSEDMILSMEAIGPAHPAIATDSNGYVHFAWSDDRNGSESEIYHKYWDGVAWSSDQRVTAAPGNSEDPALATDQNGNMYVVWIDSRDWPSYVYWKHWNGADWSNETRLPGTSYQTPSEPAVGADPSGRVHVAWEGHSYGPHRIFYMRWDGIAWTDEVAITSETSDAYNPSLAVTVDGGTHLVWRDTRDGNSEIYHSMRPGSVSPSPTLASVDPSAAPDFGTHDLTAMGEHIVLPAQLQLTRDGEATVTGVTIANSESEITARFDLTRLTLGAWNVRLISGDGQHAMLPNGLEIVQGPWSDEIRLTQDSAASSLAHNAGRALCRDAESTVHLFWYDARDGNQEIYWKTRAVDSPWSVDQRLTASAGASAYPVCAAAQGGGVLTVWQDTRNGNSEIYSKAYDGVVWSDDVRVTSQPAPSQYPALAVDGAGVFHLVWEDGRDGNWEIYYNQAVGGLWGVDQRLTEDGASSRYPSIACDDAGNVYVAWMDYREGNWEIYGKKWDGFAWSADLRLTEDDGDSADPSLYAGPGSDVYAVWVDDRDGNEEIYLRRVDVSDSPYRLTEDAAQSMNPMLAMNGDGDLYLVWSDTRTGIEQVWFKTRTGGDWSLDHRVSGSPASASLAAILAGPEEDLDVVWRDQRDGNYEIYALSRGDALSSVPGGDASLAGAARIFCRPNPFHDGTTFVFETLLAPSTQVEIYDVTGRRVRRLLSDRRGGAPGPGHSYWDGTDDQGSPLGPGVYFYRVCGREKPQVGRVIRVR